LSAPQHSHRRRELCSLFKEKLNLFDKTYRKAKRKFERDKMINIEKLNTTNPKAFWSELNKLGPRKKGNIPKEVYDNEGCVTSHMPNVFSKWNGEFQNLFQGYDKSKFDQEFYSYCQQQKEELESCEMNEAINRPVQDHEVERVLKKAKCNKAVGIDNLPYEILKNPQSRTLLTHLFNKIFTSHIILCGEKLFLNPYQKIQQ
jgi:hypothetical protein